MERRRSGLLVMAASLLWQPTIGFAAQSNRTPPQRKLTGEERAEQVVGRLTFGATPGEVDAVRRMGIDRWLTQQLHPERIDDRALEAELAQFPALQLSTTELLERLPTPQRIRQTVKQDGEVADEPHTAEEQVLYAVQVAGERQRRQAKEALAGHGTGQPMADVLPAGEIENLEGMPAEARWGRLLKMQPEELVALNRQMSERQRLAMEAGLSPEQRETVEAFGGSERVVVDELTESRVLRDVASQRQLQAVMTDFWLNHFNIFLRKKDEAFLLPEWERVVREHALGHFEDLLEATAHSPAMLQYLDNEESVGPNSQAAEGGKGQGKAKGGQRGVNENYARELMELHTLGVACEASADRPARSLPKSCDGGYTQADVTAAAEVLTGWGVDKPERVGAFQFVERRHEPGAKQVLGETISEGGEAEGEELLHRLATSPATAQLICRELAVRFVSDAPPQTLVDRMAKRWGKTHGDIAEVLWTMVHSPEFNSSAALRVKVKTPEEFVISAVRASGAQVVDAHGLVQEVARLGMPLYGMPTPQGYDWTAEPWVNTGDLLERMNFALRLAANKVAGVSVEWPTAEGEGAQAADAEERRLEEQLIGAPMSDVVRSKVLAMATGEPGGAGLLRTSAPSGVGIGASSSQVVSTMAGLLLGSPEFQRR